MKKHTEQHDEADKPEELETTAMPEVEHEDDHHSKPEVSEKTGSKTDRFKQLWNWALTHRKVSVPVAAVVLLLLLAAIPFTRYAVAGLFWKQNFSVVVMDAETNKPVTRAQINLRGTSVFTDANGKAMLHVKVGSAQMVVDKRYYKTLNQSVTVPILNSKTMLNVKLQATGRQVPITVTNKITKQAVKGIVIKAGDAEAQTDAKGQAILVVPANKTTIAVKLSAQGYTTTDVTVKVTTQADPANSFGVVPAGKVYFLSNQSGKIDVVKSNLDGSDRQVVVSGTGKESPNETSLLASQDWKYLVLWSKRDGGDNAKLFLIDTTANDQLSIMDEGNATLSSVGWVGHRFVYTVSRNNVAIWQAKQKALKSYDAESKKIALLDETAGQGTSSYDYIKESIDYVFILANGQVVYAKNWNCAYNNYDDMLQLQSKQATVNTINADGSNRKTVRGFSMASGTLTSSVAINLRAYEASALYVQFNNGDKDTFYEYENNAVTESKSVTSEVYYNSPYITYLASPSNNQTFWTEARDGKNTFFLGDQDGKHGKQIMGASKYAPFGWFTDEYLLVSKDSSELYILPKDGVKSDDQALKVGDYYRPPVSYYGYGRGYGGY